MLDHVSITVTDLEASKQFYLAALKPLGYTLMFGDYPGVVGLGAAEKADFWIAGGKESSSKVHLAFTATKRSIVDDFHTAALEAGGKDNGEPGIRPQYSPNYYAAFVFDLDGNNVEVLCQEVEEAAGGEEIHDESEENPPKKRKADEVAAE